MKLDYDRREKLIKKPELALPNATTVLAQDKKFTHYLFDGNNERGLAKGRAFESRLGYNIDNWQELQKAILDSAPLYPATIKDVNEYGTSYTQKIVLYGNKGKPANVVVGWKVDGNTTWMTTVMIKEI